MYVCSFSVFQHKLSDEIVCFSIFLHIPNTVLFPETILSVEPKPFILFCRMQEISGDIFMTIECCYTSMLCYSNWSPLQQRVCTPLYSATKALMYWVFFVVFVFVCWVFFKLRDSYEEMYNLLREGKCLLLGTSFWRKTNTTNYSYSNLQSTQK